MRINPCLECDACSTGYRASFCRAESILVQPNGVPIKMTDKLNDFRLVMKGSNDLRPRCIALMGFIGKKVHCSIYTQRAAVCSYFHALWENGIPNECCDRARLAWGLPAIVTEFRHLSQDFPREA